ncbi:hypothetical protein [Algoriphagus aquimarinus]|uniref:hypothetical protein n=1 Tax=Algoriphagus aquimarinus TaxID=237018 RepID=UPI000B8824D1|nr:hypothetical protein [Algoriphagus aquimarinus]
MKTSPLHYPSLIEAVREFKQLKAVKFAALLQHKTEQLSKKAKYLVFILFLICSLSASTYLLVVKGSSISTLPDQLPTTNLPYFPDVGNSKSDTDSLFCQSPKLQTNINHD